MTEEIKEKIRKLLALAGSSNKHEAKLALDRAIALMNRYQISEYELERDPFVAQTRAHNYAAMPEWYLLLIGAVSEVSGCTYTWRISRRGHKDDRRDFTIYGRKRDIENSLFIFDLLLRELETRVKTAKSLSGRSAKDSYRKGFICAIGLKLLEAQKRFFSTNTKEGGNALVPIDTRRVEAEAYRDSLCNAKSRRAITENYDERAFTTGAEDGAKIKLRNGIGGVNQPIARLACN
jgi:hypothetical protein